MKTVSFLPGKPSALGNGARLYSLAWKPRYDSVGDPGKPSAFAELRYVMDGPEPVAGATLILPVDDQLMFSRPGAGPGNGGVMRLLLSVRRADISREQFAHHWRTVHAPLALGLRPSYDHYITNIVLDQGSPWDGVLQEWFPDEATFDEHDQGLNGFKQTVADDYPLFLASSADCPQWLASEITLTP